MGYQQISIMWDNCQEFYLGHFKGDKSIEISRDFQGIYILCRSCPVSSCPGPLCDFPGRESPAGNPAKGGCHKYWKKCRETRLGTIHLWRQHVLWGEGCPHVLMVKRSQYIRVKNPLHKHFAWMPMVGGRGQKSWKFADVLNGWSLTPKINWCSNFETVFWFGRFLLVGAWGCLHAGNVWLLLLSKAKS